MNASLTCSKLSTTRLAEALVAGLRCELDLTPKPGLVDRWDNGSHRDLDYGLMVRSIGLLDRYYSECAAELLAGCPLERLRELGVQAEQRMLMQLGTNTHRGAIFLGGLLLGAVHSADTPDSVTVSDAVADCAHRLFTSRVPCGTTGGRVRAKYRVGGIVQEALDGYPSVFQVGIPAIREGEQMGLHGQAILFFAMARLMQTVQDTTALRRCGPLGLTRLRRDGASLEGSLRAGAVPVSLLIGINGAYREMRLTMGGVADLLGVCIAWSQFRATSTWQPLHLEPARCCT